MLNSEERQRLTVADGAHSRFEPKRFLFDKASSKNMDVCRFLLGLGLFAFYVSFITHPESLFFIPKYPKAFDYKAFSAALLILPLAASLGLVFRKMPRVSAFVLLVFHLVFRDGAFIVFEWGSLLVDLSLVSLIFSRPKTQSSVLPQRFLQGSMCFVYLVISWWQLKVTLWPNTAWVTRFVQASPFGHVVHNVEGFIPLVAAFGGLAWLAQLVAPVALWHRNLGKYWAVILMVLHAALELFMPTRLWNYAMICGLVTFLPAEWLTLDKSYWATQKTRLQEARTAFNFFFLSLIMLGTIFHHNYVLQFNLLPKVHSPSVKNLYAMVSTPFVNIGDMMMFGTVWKMYSPVWKQVMWVEWYYKKADGTVVNWPVENFSPDYRMHRRTWLEALWTDFKHEKMFVGQITEPKSTTIEYAKHLCHEIFVKTGVKPVSTHYEVFSFNKRSPDVENWSLLTQPYETKTVHSEVTCD